MSILNFFKKKKQLDSDIENKKIVYARVKLNNKTELKKQWQNIIGKIRQLDNLTK